MTLHPTQCALCNTFNNATVLYPANFQPSDFNKEIFSARRLPDLVHYQLVKCNQCGLVRSDPVADPRFLAELYKESTFEYGGEADNLKRTYGRYLVRLERYAPRGGLLEIGCGNGFFLEEAIRQGYQDVTGVEPSVAAVENARSEVRTHLVIDIMRPGLFPSCRFQAICLFQVFDHISEPVQLLKECFRVLVPGGVVLCLNHNVESFSAKLLKEKSPIIDIEHTYLYSPKTLKQIFEQQGFESLEWGAVWNTYSAAYLLRLLPIPKSWKLNLANSWLRKIALRVPLGNLYLIARKPAT